MWNFKTNWIIPCITTFVTGAFGVAVAQDNPATENSFASENAVLDTSILFAIGAREARQELRGSFGWPTFQEGLVEGVYFRFDPDGYARFAPTPRLDADVFEVICRPRTHTCMGRKGALEVTLNSRGQIQLQIENSANIDTFVIAEDVTELPLPETILQPLDQRFEILLGTGGDLVGRRGDAEVLRVSLAGFSAVIPYLRWVAARQEYTALPKGWPVPNGLSSSPSGTPIIDQWSTTRPNVSQSLPSQSASLSESLRPSSPIGNTRGVRDELEYLRNVLREGQPQSAFADTTQDETLLHPRDLEADVAKLMLHVENLLTRLEEVGLDNGWRLSHNQMKQAPAKEEPAAEVHDEEELALIPGDLAQHLEYLTVKLGMDPEAALKLAQDQMGTEDRQSETAQTDLVAEIMQELRSQIPLSSTSNTKKQPSNEYELLTEYFSSVREFE